MSPAARSALDDLPAQTVRQLRSSAEAVAAWAERSGQRLVAVDLAGCRSKRDVLAALARAFTLPSWFGMNLDALYDALTDLDDAFVGDGLIIVLDGLPAGAQFDRAQRDALIAVFRDSAADYATRGVPFRVLYR
jgi:RNAse (barnase) inhibitor barstar